MPVSAYSTTPAANVAISGIDISENCAPSGYNNALRQIMADIKAWTDAYAPISTPVSIANGGTASATAAAALTALGAFPAAGGTVTGATTFNAQVTAAANIVRSGKGVHPYWGSTSATGGQMYLQAVGSDPTVNPYDVVFEY